MICMHKIDATRDHGDPDPDHLAVKDQLQDQGDPDHVAVKDQGDPDHRDPDHVAVKVEARVAANEQLLKALVRMAVQRLDKFKAIPDSST